MCRKLSGSASTILTVYCLMTVTENTSNISATSMLDPSGTMFDDAELNITVSFLISSSLFFRVLLRVRMLYYLKQEVIGEHADSVLRGADARYSHCLTSLLLIKKITLFKSLC